MKKIITILSIETSLDDTCAAITQNDRVISNVIASQSTHHEEFGGVVPDIAKRLHQKYLKPTINKALQLAKTNLSELDAISVTQGPGLAPALEQGILLAKEMALSNNLPLIAVNHLEGHILSSFANNSKGNKGIVYKKSLFPSLGFVISGGHTELVLVKDIGDYKLLGQTLDDAAGEAYDKVARMLELGYPGGPLLSELAKSGSPVFNLPVPMKSRKDLNFSFSGLKTAALYKLKTLNPILNKKFTQDFAASFQNSVFLHLADRLNRAIDLYSPRSLLLGGGVVSNVALRNFVRTQAKAKNIPTYIPYSQKLFTDNAAMIGIVAYFKYKRNEFVKNINGLDRDPNLNFPK